MTTSFGVTTKNKTDEKRRLSEDVLKRKEDIIGFRRYRRGRLIFSKVIRKNERKKTSRNRNIKI